jgi:hypothetical protein
VTPTRAGESVTIEQLQQRLRREATKNPKQAAVLGLLLVVALWFWAPLVWSWLPKDQQASAPQSEQPTTVASQPKDDKPAEAEPAEAATVGPTWETLAAWMKQDPLMAPATRLVGDRNPFANAEPVEVVEIVEPPRREERKEWTPDAMGLVLTSTIVGPRKRAALISGRAYTQGEKIVRQVEDARVVFELVEVYPRRIVLARDHARYELKLAEP